MKKGKAYLRCMLLLWAVLIISVLGVLCRAGHRGKARWLRPLGGAPAAAELTLQVAVREGTCTMEIEQYLIGVVAAEMPASFAPEALAAQAVAARTYTLSKYLGGGCGEADVCTASSHCQAWCSKEELEQKWGEDFAQNYARVQQAVQATAGQVLCYGGQPIEALFHSSSPGATEACVQVFAKDLPYLTSVASPEAVQRSEVSLSYEDCIARLEAAVGHTGLSPANITQKLQVAEYTASGRVARLQAGEQVLSGKAARSALGLKSACFTIGFAEGQVCFTVAGYGHGVGMSQYGAQAMAQGGSTWQQILAHYYPGTSLAPIGDFLS